MPVLYADILFYVVAGFRSTLREMPLPIDYPGDDRLQQELEPEDESCMTSFTSG